MMTPLALEAIAKLTGEPTHPCKVDGIVYAVSKSWLVWYAKDDWHAVYRPECRHKYEASLRGAILDANSDYNGKLASGLDVDPQSLDLEALRQHVKTCGYTMVDVAIRMGYVPTNKRVSKQLSGAVPVTKEFCQRAVAAFGRGVLRGE